MPPDNGPAETVVTTAEAPTEQVAEQMDEAAQAVGDAAEAAAEEGLDGLANRLRQIETTLQGHLQHPHDHSEPVVAETVATPVAAETVEVAVPEPVVKPRKLHIFQRMPRGF